MNMKPFRRTSAPLQAGFSLLELMIVCAILSIVMIAIVRGINITVQRSEAEQTKVDLTQSAREFVDEFERDLHQAGYPNCRMVTTLVAGIPVANNCPADYSAGGQAAAANPALAVGLVYVSSTRIIFEGAMDGTGTVYSVQYRLVDAAGNNPPLSCPCILQRSEQAKNPAGVLPLAQPTFFSQELQNVVNSGQPVGVAPYGGGAPINGGTAWGATNDAYYAAIASFRDYPVFQAYDQSGTIISINPAIDLSATPNATQILTCSVSTVNCVKSIRLTINLLANATTGADLQTKVRPVTTLVGNARLVNN
jgi:prepilin-type N-terminal cleavage/methylation domain-containing protein